MPPIAVTEEMIDKFRTVLKKRMPTMLINWELARDILAETFEDDLPPLGEEDFKRMKPIAEVPELAAVIEEVVASRKVSMPRYELRYHALEEKLEAVPSPDGTWCSVHELRERLKKHQLQLSDTFAGGSMTRTDVAKVPMPTLPVMPQPDLYVVQYLMYKNETAARTAAWMISQQEGQSHPIDEYVSMSTLHATVASALASNARTTA